MLVIVYVWIKMSLLMYSTILTLCYRATHSFSNENIIHSISYSEFAGIMIGMVIFGSLADIIGRNAAGILTSVFMLGGVTVMAFSKTT